MDFTKQICLNCKEDCMRVDSMEVFRLIDPDEYKGSRYWCDRCDRGSPSWPAWHCIKCLSDWCAPCAFATRKSSQKLESADRDSADERYIAPRPKRKKKSPPPPSHPKVNTSLLTGPAYPRWSDKEQIYLADLKTREPKLSMTIIVKKHNKKFPNPKRTKFALATRWTRLVKEGWAEGKSVKRKRTEDDQAPRKRVKKKKKKKKQDQSKTDASDTIAMLPFETTSIETGFVDYDQEFSRLEGPYASKVFWDSHYEKQAKLNNGYDWFCYPEEAYKAFQKYLPKKKDGKVLEMGCGNKPILDILEKRRTFQQMIGADFSPTVISKLRERTESNIQFEVQDAKRTSYFNDFFDLIISKGLLDAIDCGCDLGTGADNFDEVVQTAQEMHRILKFGGLWFIICMCSVNKRLEFLQDLKLEHDRRFDVEKTFVVDSNIDKMNVCHCIVLRKVKL